MAAISQEMKRQNTVQFIEATKKLIDAEGIENLSVRKIAEQAGFHNSTIYLYFEDVEQLIMLATVKYLAKYSSAISAVNMKDYSVLDTFYAVWRYFAETVFEKPQLFYNFFFGKRREKLKEIVTRYYELFPEEKNEYTKEIEEMFYAGNIHERCLIFLRPLMKEGCSQVTAENIELVNEIIVCCLKSLLEDKCQKPEDASGRYTEKMLNIIQFTIGV